MTYLLGRGAARAVASLVSNEQCCTPGAHSFCNSSQLALVSSGTACGLMEVAASRWTLGQMQDIWRHHIGPLAAVHWRDARHLRLVCKFLASAIPLPHIVYPEDEESDNVSEADATRRVLLSPEIIMEDFRLPQMIGFLSKFNHLRSFTSTQWGSFGFRGKAEATLFSDFVSANRCLTSLTIRYVKFSVEAEIIVGEALKGCQSLRELNLASCRFGKGCRPMSMLADVVSSNSHVEALSIALLRRGDEMLPLPLALLRLQFLDISAISLIDEDQISFAGALKSNTSLKTLRFAGPASSLEDNTRWCDELVRVLLVNKSLTSMSVTAQGYETETRLLAALESCSLRSFTLQFAFLTDEGVHNLANSLRRNTTIRDLEVVISQDNEASLFSAALVESLQRLESVVVNGSGKEADLLADSWRQMLASTSSLKTLRLHECSIANVFSGISEGMRSNTTLTELDFGMCDLTSDDAAALTDALQSNSTLTKLDLTCCNLEGEQANADFFSRLQSLAALRTLILSSCYLPHATFEKIGSFLNENKTLRELDLSSNHLTADSAAPIAVGLRSNTTLRRLGVQFSKFYDEGANLWADLLCANGSLELLMLGYTFLGAESRRRLRRLASKNSISVWMAK